MRKTVAEIVLAQPCRRVSTGTTYAMSRRPQCSQSEVVCGMKLLWYLYGSVAQQHRVLRLGRLLFNVVRRSQGKLFRSVEDAICVIARDGGSKDRDPAWKQEGKKDRQVVATESNAQRSNSGQGVGMGAKHWEAGTKP